MCLLLEMGWSGFPGRPVPNLLELRFESYKWTATIESWGCVCVGGSLTHDPKGNVKMKKRNAKPTLCNINCQQLSSATVCIIWFIPLRARSAVIVPISLIEKLKSKRLHAVATGRAGTHTQEVRTHSLSLQHL